MKYWTQNQWNRFSFRQQLTLTFSVGIVCLAFFSTIIISSVSTRNVSNQLVLQGRKITENLARQSTLALLYQSPEMAREVAQATLAFPDVLNIGIYNAGHDVLFQSDGQALSPSMITWSVQHPEFHENNSSWYFSAPVIATINANDEESPFAGRPLQNELVGYVLVEVTKNTLHVMSGDILRINMLIVGGLASVLLLLLLAITNRLTRPLQRLAIDMRRAEEGKIGLRARLHGSTDLMKMESAFNKMMDELESREEELIRARDVALDAARMKGIFAATVSHELRTPMNGIFGMLQLLEQSQLEEQEQQYVQIATSSAKSLLVLIDDILDFTKIESGKMRFHCEDFDLRELTMDVIELLALQARQKKLMLSVIVDQEVPFCINADSGRVRQVLINLVGNAIKFTHKGHITLHVSSKQEGGNPLLSIQVRDTGVGIEEDAQKRIFDSFVQADGSTTRRYGGTGLGLNICRQLIELMGGSIGVVSKPNEGSTFWFTLPLGVAEFPPESESYELHRLTGLRVLIAGQDNDRRNILTALFISWECFTESTAEAEQALQKIRQASADGRPYDLVLVDMHPSHEVSEEAYVGKVDRKSARTLILTDAEPYSNPYPNSIRYLPAFVDSVTLYKTILRILSRDTEAEISANRERPAGGISILVVEDNRANRQVAVGMLERLGYTVDVAEDGAAALEKIAEVPFDIVLMDCHMPGVDGYEATKRIRQGETIGKRLPILAMTAHTSRDDRKHCISAGMDDYLSKPLGFEELEEKLTLWLNTTARVSEPPAVDSDVVTAKSDGRSFPVSVEKIQLMRESMEENFNNFMGSFLEDTPQILQKLYSAVDEANVKHIIEFTLAIKSRATSLGAGALAELCQNLIVAVKAGDLKSVRQWIKKIAKEYEQVEGAVRDEIFPVNGKLLRLPPKESTNILIVDDDRSARFAVQGILERDGYSILEASSGGEAIEACSKKMPDLILMDAMMPEIDGFLACRKILQLPGETRPIILMLTALHDDESIERAFSAGAADFIPKPVNLMLLRRRVARLLQSTHAEKHEQKMANYDSITSLANREMFLARARDLIRVSHSQNQIFALLLMDIDRFSVVNDVHGRDVGDLLLKTIGQRLQGCIRTSSLVARIDGDQFMVILDKIQTPESVVKKAQKICQTMAEPFSFMDQRIHLSTSIGIAMYPHNGNNVGVLLRRVETALFKAKSKGGNCFKCYEHGMESEIVRRIELERELRSAVDNNELVLHYQPQADLHSGKHIGMEALIRWQHPERGLMPPSEFIPLAEECGVIHQISEWMLKEACRQQIQWLTDGFEVVPVALNVSNMLLKSGTLAGKIRDVLEETQLKPQLLKLEINENTLTDVTEIVLQQMTELKEAGLVLEIDDFGTGYFSLSHLKGLPIEGIKIDRLFIKKLPDDRDDAAVVAGVIGLAHRLGLAVIAEGVETSEHMSFLQQLNCDAMQGYFLSRPLPASEIEHWMKEFNS